MIKWRKEINSIVADDFSNKVKNVTGNVEKFRKHEGRPNKFRAHTNLSLYMGSILQMGGKK